MKHRARLGGFCGILALLVACLAPAASAFPRPQNNCIDDTVTFYFSDDGPGGAWSTWQENAARAGILDWNAVLDWDGGKVVDSLYEVSGPGGGAVEVKLDDSPGGSPDSLGHAECTWPGASISMNPDFLLSSASMEHWTRHEMGHLLGQEHTGLTDAFEGGVETMATCHSVNSTAPSLSQDGYGGIVHKLGDLDPDTIHANAGFEQGTSWWGSEGVSYWYTTTSNPEDGSASLQWQPAYDRGGIYQSMNYAAAGGTTIDARTNHRKIYSSATYGYVILEIWVRQVTYQSNPQCDYPTNKDQNHRSYEGDWTRVRYESASPSTSWAMLTESTAYTVPSSWDAADVRVRVKSTVRYSSWGGLASLGTDTTRARD